METSPNVIGYVTEFTEDFGPDGERHVQLKLRLKNTLGEERVQWVGGPEDLAEFYGSEPAKTPTLKATSPIKDTLGAVLDLQEARDVSVVRDTLGGVADLVPSGLTKTRIKVMMPLPSGRSVEFWTDVPPEIVPYLSEHIKIPRTIPELFQQLENDLAGVEDDHDKAVRLAESRIGGDGIKGLKQRLLEQQVAYEDRVAKNLMGSEPAGDE